MVDTIPALISIQTARGAIEVVNRQILDFTGQTLDELRDWSATVHRDDRAETMRLWGHSIETGHPLDTEVRLRRGDGVYRWFHARALPLRDTEGSIARWYTLLIDIEDRKRAEAALRATELNFRLIVDSIPGLLCTNTAAGA